MKTCLAASILLAAMTAAAIPAQAQQPPGEPPAQDAPAQELDEVLVEGERGLPATTRFVRSVAPPIGDRGLARWNSPVCVGVGGLEASAAQAMADRISDWAFSLGVEIAHPGCEPTIMVVATDDADRTARDLVAARPRQFRVGTPGADRGSAALQAFRHDPRPVRWWHVALPMNPDTERPAVRLPGDAPFAFPPGGLTRPGDLGEYGLPGSGSRLTRRTRDDLVYAVIVVDIDALDRVEFGQLADFVSMVALAHIDMRGDTSAVPTILGLFDPGRPSEPTLTEWDRAFLKALYGAEQTSTNPRANAAEVANAMRRELDREAGRP